MTEVDDDGIRHGAVDRGATAGSSVGRAGDDASDDHHDPSDEGPVGDVSVTRVLLVRHGESEWNVERRLQGHSGPGLSPAGHDQGRAAGAWLAAMLGTAPVVSSDLQRARETADHVAAALGVEVTEDPDLRERSWGAWEGRTVEELTAEGSSAWRRRTDGEDVAPEVGGESGPDLAARVVPAIRRHASGREAVVLVTHGGSIWHGLHDLLGLPGMTLGGVANTGVSEVLLTGDGHAWLQSYNLQGHVGLDGIPVRSRERHHA